MISARLRVAAALLLAATISGCASGPQAMISLSNGGDRASEVGKSGDEFDGLDVGDAVAFFKLDDGDLQRGPVPATTAVLRILFPAGPPPGSAYFSEGELAAAWGSASVFTGEGAGAVGAGSAGTGSGQSQDGSASGGTGSGAASVGSGSAMLVGGLLSVAKTFDPGLIKENGKTILLVTLTNTSRDRTLRDVVFVDRLHPSFVVDNQKNVELRQLDDNSTVMVWTPGKALGAGKRAALKLAVRIRK